MAILWWTKEPDAKRQTQKSYEKVNEKCKTLATEIKTENQSLIRRAKWNSWKHFCTTNFNDDPFEKLKMPKSRLNPTPMIILMNLLISTIVQRPIQFHRNPMDQSREIIKLILRIRVSICSSQTVNSSSNNSKINKLINKSEH